MIDTPYIKRVYTETNPIFKPVSEWKYQNHSWFWVVEDIFKEGGLELFKEILLRSYPIVDTNNHDDDWDHNPFMVHHLPYWITSPLCEAVREFVIRNHFGQRRDGIHR